MASPRISEPAELDHVVYYLGELVSGLPHTVEHLRSLLSTMADDARQDLTAEKLGGWDLTDIADLDYILSLPPVPPGPGEMFMRTYLNTLEEAAAQYLSALLVAIQFPEQMVGEDIERIESLARALLSERQAAAILRMDPHANRGYKLHLSEKKGHEAVHGTKEEKQARWKQYQDDLDELRQKNPRLSYTSAAQKVAAKHGVNIKTITRNTTNRTN